MRARGSEEQHMNQKITAEDVLDRINIRIYGLGGAEITDAPIGTGMVLVLGNGQRFVIRVSETSE
jgi:hypothetical protein